MAQFFHRSLGSSIAQSAACIAVGCLLLGACSGDDRACEETKSCASNAGGSGDKRDGAAGAAGRGGDSGGTGGTANDGGLAGDGSLASDGSGVDAGGTAGEGGAVVDTTPPTVVSFVPADGAKGVLKDANIVITFSEPMNQQSAQAAYQSADVAAANVVFNWNTEGTVLTINPNSDFAYATGVLPASTVAYAYNIGVTTTATDRAGNPLAEARSARFSSLRWISHALTLPNGKGQSVNGAGSVVSCPTIRMLVGDNPADEQTKVVMTFDITDYPAGIVAFEHCALTAEQQLLVAPNGLGSLLIEHTNLRSVDASAFSGPALTSLGVFSADNYPGLVSKDVLVAVRDDYAHRSERANQSQYRFAYELESDIDGINDVMTFACAPAPTLTSTYLVP